MLFQTGPQEQSSRQIKKKEITVLKAYIQTEEHGHFI